MLLGRKLVLQTGFSSCSPRQRLVMVIGGDSLRGLPYDPDLDVPPISILCELLAQVPLTHRVDVRKQMVSRFNVNERDLIVPPVDAVKDCVSTGKAR